MSKIRLGIIQPEINENTLENLTRYSRSIQSLAAKGADLIVLPELQNGPYFCQSEDVANFDIAEPIPGPSTDYYARLAKENNVLLLVTLFEKRGRGLCHNTAVVFGRDGGIRGKYRKMHIPDDPGYYEKFYFTPGDIGFKPIDTEIGRLGVMICWDQWYPEGARLMALAGADLLIYPTAIGYTTDDDPDEIKRQREAWITVQRGHAVANNLHVVAVNRTGYEPDLTKATKGVHFWGSSFVCGPQGEILAMGREDAEEEMLVEIDTERTDKVRHWWPFLRDRRIDKYGDLTLRYRD